MPCDRCGSDEHNTDACPHFPRTRGNHTDAQPLPAEERALLSHNGPEVKIRARGVRHRVPGDGSCLFHALLRGVYLLGLVLASRITTALALRQILLRWLLTKGGGVIVGGSTLLVWMRRETGKPQQTMSTYAHTMRDSTKYAGALEIVAFVHT